MGNDPIHLLDQTPDSLAAWCASREMPPYRARQVLEWVYGRSATAFDGMTNLPARLRKDLAGHFVIYASTVVARRAASDGTTKLLLRWPDGATSECVLIPEEERNTACISSQVGCPVRCSFCASGADGLERQLTAGEIVEQAMRVRSLLDAGAGGAARLSNVVVMGIGEPLANYDAVLAAIRAINAPWGMNIGARKITLSTVGLPRQIRRLADEGLQINLAISLHAAADDVRRRLIPWAERVTILDLVDAARYYFTKTGREVTLEYVMLAGVNVRQADARRLARVAGRMRCNVNLIPYNPVEGQGYERPGDAAMDRFARDLRNLGVNAHIRRSRGLDIEAACGQLRAELSGGEGGRVIRTERPGNGLTE